MKLEKISKQISKWFDGRGPHSEIVISSRIRLARNIAGYEFLPRLKPDRQADILEKLKNAILSVNVGEEVFFIDVAESSAIEQDLMVERHLISHRHARGRGPRGAVIAGAESFTAMINEEDHLRLQVFKNGLQLHECLDEINKIDDEIEKQVEYAFSPKYGYFTACPTNLGTGIRVSVMLHLPALKMTGQIEKFFNATRDTDLTVRGLFGEGTEAIGDFYQLSNQITLGVSEEEIVEEFTNNIVPKIIDYETLAREELLSTQKAVLDDKIQRAMGILKSARLISSQEALFLLSNVRLGVNLGRIKDIDISTVNELFMLTQPAHLQINNQKILDPEQRDIVRAEIIRKRLAAN